MRNPVTIGMWDENDIICVITVDENDKDRAVECMVDGYHMWYGVPCGYEDTIIPEDWDMLDWISTVNGYKIDDLFYVTVDKAVKYLLEKRNIKYILEDDLIRECKNSDDPDIFSDRVTWM